MSRRKRHSNFSGVAPLLLLLASGSADAQTPEQRAQSAIDAVKSNWEDADAIEMNFSSPLNGAGSFTSFDGATPFAQPIACLSSDAFLEVFFAPSANGDLSPVNVSQDTNFDGIFDVTQTLPSPVSGVCANGVISCTPGTWSGCEAFAWSADNSNRLGLAPVALDELGGCYCVNNSCGTSLAILNEENILSNLAGGMAGALMQNDPRFAVATVGRSPFQISLSGQSTTSCRTPPTLAQTAYVNNPSQLPIDAAAMSATDPIFSKVTSLPAGSSVTTLDHSCSIERLTTVIDDIASVVKISGSGEYSLDVISATEMVMTMGRDDNNYLNKSCTVGHIDWYTIQVLEPNALVSVVLEDGRVDDDLQLHRDGQNLVFARRSNFTNYVGGRPGSCSGNRNDIFSVNMDLTSIFTDGAPHEFRLRSVVSGVGERFLKIRFKTKCALEEVIQDTCSVFATNSECQLRDELVDGVRTYQNGAATGLTPLPSTRTLGSGACTFDVTQPWWLRDRNYRCTATGTGSALPVPDLKRVRYIYDNSTITAWSDQYTDASGNVISASGALSPPEPVVVGDCEQMCKTTRPYQNTHVTQTGTAGDLQTDRIDTEFAFHSCRTDICPVGPGETIVTDCSCVDAFREAMVMMQAVRLGARDYLCTTDTPVPF